MNPLLVSLALLACFVRASQVSPDSLTFVASSPCDALPRKHLSIPAETDCELITWRLTLYRNPANQTPTTYELTCIYGLSKPGTRGFMNGGSTETKRGKWINMIGPGTRTVYRLDPDTPAGGLSFLRLNDQLLHLLDQQGNLMIGHAGWSYTMNRQ